MTTQYYDLGNAAPSNDGTSAPPSPVSAGASSLHGGGGGGWTPDVQHQLVKSEIAAGRMTLEQGNAMLKEGGVQELTAKDLPSESPATSMYGKDGWTQEVQHKLVKSEIAAGRLTLDQGNEMLISSGMEPLPLPEKFSNPEAQQVFNDNPVPQLHEYNMPYLESPHRDQFDKVGRSILHTGKFSYMHGKPLAQRVADVARECERLTPEQIELRSQKQIEMLERTYGADLPKKMELAHELVDSIEAKMPGTKKFLEATGASGDLLVIHMFIQQAERLDIVRNGRKRS